MTFRGTVRAVGVRRTGAPMGALVRNAEHILAARRLAKRHLAHYVAVPQNVSGAHAPRPLRTLRTGNPAEHRGADAALPLFEVGLDPIAPCGFLPHDQRLRRAGWM